MKNYNYDPSMQEDEHQEKLNNAYLGLKARHGIKELRQQYSELKRLIDEAYDTASDYTGFDLRDELATELPRMD